MMGDITPDLTSDDVLTPQQALDRRRALVAALQQTSVTPGQGQLASGTDVGSMTDGYLAKLVQALVGSGDQSSLDAAATGFGSSDNDRINSIAARILQDPMQARGGAAGMAPAVPAGVASIPGMSGVGLDSIAPGDRFGQLAIEGAAMPATQATALPANPARASAELADPFGDANGSHPIENMPGDVGQGVDNLGSLGNGGRQTDNDFLHAENASYQPGDFNVRDITAPGDTLMSLFARNTGYAPSAGQLIAYGNYNRLSSPHDVSSNREVIFPGTQVLGDPAYAASAEQMQNYLARNAQFADAAKRPQMNRVFGANFDNIGGFPALDSMAAPTPRLGPTIESAIAQGLYDGPAAQPNQSGDGQYVGAARPLSADELRWRDADRKYADYYGTFDGQMAQAFNNVNPYYAAAHGALLFGAGMGEAGAGDYERAAALGGPGVLEVVGARGSSGAGSGERAFISAEEFSRLPKAGTIDPSVIRFSQNNAKATFRPPYGSVDDFINGLRNGTVDPLSIEPIRLVENNGQIYTLDNRRLYSFQQAGVPIQYQMLDSIPKSQLFKFTTRNEGVSIMIRKGAK